MKNILITNGMLWIIVIIVTMTIIMVGGYCVYKLRKMIKKQRCRIDALLKKIIELNQKISSIGKCHIDNEEYRVLCIGNSITIHPPFNGVNWYSNHGMAASKPVNDYCHILEEKIRQHNPHSSVLPVNLAVWEKDFSIDLNELLSEVCKNKNVIIIRLGENVKEVSRFKDALSHLIDYCLTFTDNIILTGLYWKDGEKEEAIIYNVHKYGLTYVPLDWILESYVEDCTPQEGDVLYDTNGLEYFIEGDFILSHPNDFGMRLIANALYKSL